MPRNRNHYLLMAILFCLLFVVFVVCVKRALGANPMSSATSVNGTVMVQPTGISTGSVQISGVVAVSNIAPQTVLVVFTNAAIPFLFSGTNATATIGGTNFQWVVTHTP